MKLLIINSVCGISSTGRICVDIAESYIERGWECIIAYGRGHCPEKYRDISYRIGNQFGPVLHAMGNRLFDNDGFSAKKQTRRFLKWADSFCPDLVWIHNLHGYYINAELLFNWIKKRPKLRVKWTLHDCWSFTGHCCYFDYAGCQQWKNGCKKCLCKRDYPKALVFSNSQKNYKKKHSLFKGVNNLQIITPSKWLASLVKESFLSEYSVVVRHNTIDKSVFKPSESDFRVRHGVTDKKIVLGVAYPWSKRKGLEDFIRLSSLLSDDFVVVLVGLNKRQIDRLPRNIIGVSKTNNAVELAGIYSTSDIFLNLTYEDNYPTVNLEAQACGTPCITYDTGGSTESVPPENVVSKGDIDGLVIKIHSILRI